MVFEMRFFTLTTAQTMPATPTTISNRDIILEIQRLNEEQNVSDSDYRGRKLGMYGECGCSITGDGRCICDWRDRNKVKLR